MKRWQYHVHACPLRQLSELLETLGQQGWELVSVLPSPGGVAGQVLAIFKRDS
jgi:hypothetical protein